MVTIRLDSVGAAYGGKTVLSDITTHAFRDGEIVAVIGPNAAGKSTLLKRIAGIVKGPGRVLLEGTGDRSQTISYMPQEDAGGAALTVYESVLLACKQGGPWRVSKNNLDRVDHTICALQITDIGFRYLYELSGGQRQLVGIAQSLVRDPAVLLMDEPTSALDLCRQIEVLSLLRRIVRERRIVAFIALHDLNQAMHFADKAILVASGSVQQYGDCSDVITTPMLRKVYKVAARIERCSRERNHVIVDGVVGDLSASDASPDLARSLPSEGQSV